MIGVALMSGSLLVRNMFEDCQVDTDVLELRRLDEPIRIEPHLVRGVRVSGASP
jgi:hypothetical protein